MAIEFDSNSLGAILEYGLLREDAAPRTAEKQAWERTNIRSSDVALLQPWSGPPGTLTQTFLIGMLQIGRDAGEVRRTVDWAFRVLEMHRLIVPWAVDANPATAYRTLSS